MNVARLCAIQLTRRLRQGTMCHPRYYCSISKSSELNDSVRNPAEVDKHALYPAGRAVQTNVTDEDSSQGEDPEEMVDMWNKDAIAGPEWNGPRGYEPTKYGDWSSKGRVTDF